MGLRISDIVRPTLSRPGFGGGKNAVFAAQAAFAVSRNHPCNLPAAWFSF